VHRAVGLYKLNSVYPAIESASAWFHPQPLNLKCDILVSKSAFKCNLCRYSAGFRAPQSRGCAGRVGTFHVIQSRTRVMGWHFSRYSVQNSGYGLALSTLFCSDNTVQLMTASSV
jgi:hypothetical protein